MNICICIWVYRRIWQLKILQYSLFRSSLFVGLQLWRRIEKGKTLQYSLNTHHETDLILLGLQLWWWGVLQVSWSAHQQNFRAPPLCPRHQTFFQQHCLSLRAPAYYPRTQKLVSIEKWLFPAHQRLTSYTSDSFISTNVVFRNFPRHLARSAAFRSKPAHQGGWCAGMLRGAAESCG